ncbi:MAG TPA: 1-deoxy-D-xylulose-5-phosphate reductoisomerase [Terriglobales bacterium]|nr:1-deoxy-D-xylulose-5-phosphate reductoisomerase [Terriglobales bacterium]
MTSVPPRRVALLGSTGSIGRNTLDVIASLPDRLQVVALAAGDNVEEMTLQVARFRPALASMRTAAAAEALRKSLRAQGIDRTEILHGAEGLLAAATASGVNLLVAATVGVASLAAIAAALERGCDLALANKEALVVAGTILMDLACRGGSAILPVDSEHSAIHQCLRGGAPAEVERLVLTASGGPLLRLPASEMEAVTPAQALRHPTWNMGARISLDSATMMNKGFEIIEACHLFGVREDQVEVLVHPQSIVHSMVEFTDGSVLAQLGTADMRTPIQYALTYPERVPSARIRLKLEEVNKLEFEAPDETRFPCLRLARQALRAGGGAAAVLNAADEVAVGAFRQGQITFPGIARVVDRTLQELGAPAVASVEEIQALDARARRAALACIRA